MTPEERNRRYVRKATEAVIRDASLAGSGARNVELFKSATRLLELHNAMPAELGTEEVRALIFEAASAAGLPRKEALTVFKSAARRVGNARAKLPAESESFTVPASDPSVELSALLRGVPNVEPDTFNHAPASDLEAVWNLAEPSPPEVLAVLSGKPRPGLDGARVRALDLARLLPRDARLPGWCSWWLRGGYRVLVRAFDASGTLASLRARPLDAPEGERPKEYPPKGFDSGGTIAACPLAVGLLQRRPEALEQVAAAGIVLTEGVPSFLAWAGRYGDANEDAPAVFGYWPGAWSEAFAASVPDGTRVVIDPDANDTGERLRRKIIKSFGARGMNFQDPKESAHG